MLRCLVAPLTFVKTLPTSLPKVVSCNIHFHLCFYIWLFRITHFNHIVDPLTLVKGKLWKGQTESLPNKISRKTFIEQTPKIHFYIFLPGPAKKSLKRKSLRRETPTNKIKRHPCQSKIESTSPSKNIKVSTKQSPKMKFHMKYFKNNFYQNTLNVPHVSDLKRL